MSRFSSPLTAAPALVIYWLSCYSGALLATNMASLSQLAQSFGLESAGLARMLSALALGGVLALYGARLSDRLGRRRMLLMSALLSYPVALATAFAPSVQWYVGLQMIAAGLVGTLHITTLVAIEEHLPASLKAKGQAWVGVFFVVGNGGGLMFVAITSHWIAADSWRYVWGFFALAAVLHPLAAFFLVETPEFVASQQAQRGHNSGGNRWRDLLSPSHARLTLCLFAALFCWDLAQAGVNAWLIYHPMENLGITQSWMTVIFIVGGWPALFGFALGVWLRDHLGGYRTAMLASCLIAAAGNAVFYGLKPEAPLLLALLTTAYIVGLLMANALMVNVRLFINEHYPIQQRASMQSLVIFANAFSAVLAQLLIAGLIEPLGGVALAVLGLLTLKIAAALLFVGLPRLAVIKNAEPCAVQAGVSHLHANGGVKPRPV
ncbi:MFS family permease [Litorivivens lipolytica]|uniref:MFS family permease n=1 Tax=Litorivivens lipolytica TaxID=1524264 RepID=A0A7W4Z6U0_9GAMM|nr:MFS transporter [Litorivivens lipolytica]MBB3047221.1 MFS family permease [Litorivivens lipolytica]